MRERNRGTATSQVTSQGQTGDGKKSIVFERGTFKVTNCHNKGLHST